LEEIMRALRFAPYHLYVATEGPMVIGISLVDLFPNMGVAFLDYLAVAPSHQRRGVGACLFKHTLKELYRLLPDPLGLLFEVQKEDASDPKEQKTRLDRIRFYTKLGARLLEGVHYALPPQDGTKPEEMYLMMFPCKDMAELPSNFVIQCIEMIYHVTYGYEKDDLLDAASRRMPQRVRLTVPRVPLVPYEKQTCPIPNRLSSR